MKLTLKNILLIYGISILFLALFQVILLTHNHAELSQALGDIISSGEFWINTVLPFTLFSLLVLITVPTIHRWMTAGRRGTTFNWSRSRISFTLMGIIALLLLGLLILWPLIFGGPAYHWDQFTTLLIIWISYAIFIGYRFFMKPDPDMVHGYETGDHTRFDDERHRQIWSNAAVTTIYWLIGTIISAGTIFDIFVTKIWPLRSIFEVLLIVVVWHVNSQKWSKKI